MKKKILLTLALIFAIVCTVGIMNISLAANSGSCGTNVNFSFSNGVLTISGNGSMRDYLSGGSVKPWHIDYKYDHIKEVVIEEGVTHVGRDAFYGHDFLEKVTIADSVTTIGEVAFFGCSKLKEVEWGSGVQAVESRAFEFCKSLTHIYIKNLVSWCGISFAKQSANPISADDGTFTGLYLNGNLVEGDLVIPDGTTKIAKYVFENYDVLTSVTLPASVSDVSAYSFIRCDSLNEIFLNENNEYYSLQDGILFSKDKTKLVMYLSKKEISDYIVPESVTHLEDYAFAYNTTLKSVTIGEGVTALGAGVFDYCSGIEEIRWNAVALNEIGFLGEIGEKDVGINLIIGDNVETLPKIFAGTSIKSIEFGDGNITLAEEAFRYCHSLTEVIFGKGTTNIGRSSFEECSALKSVTFGGEGAVVGQSAFAKCKALENINFGNGNVSIGYRAFYDCDGITDLDINATAIATEAFYDCDGIINLNINTATIGSSAFYSCGEIKNLTIGENVTGISGRAFYSLGSLEKLNWNARNVTDFNYDETFNGAGRSGNGVEVIFGDSVEAIPDWVFWDGTLSNGTISNTTIPNIKSITIGKNVVSVGSSAFRNLEYLEKVIWNAREVKDFDRNSGIFFNAGINSNGIDFVFGDDVVSIPSYILCIEYKNNMPNIKKITFGKNIQIIGSYAFYLSNAIISPLPESVTTINAYAFSKCTGITEMVIGVNVTSISGTFMSDSSIKKLYWNSTKLTNYSISVGTDASVEIIYGDNVTTISKAKAFAGNITKINLNNVTNINAQAFDNCMFVKSYEVSDNNPAFSIVDGMLFNKDKTKLIKYVKRDNERTFVVPEYVTDIAYGAFNGFTNLEEITLSKNIKNIENYAFSACKNLKKINWNITNPNDFAKRNYIFYDTGNTTDGITVVFGENVERFPANMFYTDTTTNYCTRIKSITIPETITMIPDYAFAYCRYLTEINIHSNITSIGQYAFYCAAFEKITIPGSVTKIGAYAFGGCNSLKSLTVGENASEIGSYAFYSCGVLEKVYWNVKSINDFISSSYVFLHSGLKGDGIDVVFGNSVTRIPAYLFYGNKTENAPKVKTVKFGNSITSIGNYAFHNCIALESVNFLGTANEKQYSVGTNNAPFTSLSLTYAKGTRSKVSQDRKTISVTPVNVESGIDVIIALYNNGAFVGTQSATYNNGELNFNTAKAYTDVKIMLWNDLADLKALCEAESLQ